MGMEREEDGEAGGEMPNMNKKRCGSSNMGNRCGSQNARLNDQGGITEEKLRGKAGIRALKYEERLRKRQGSEIARKCEEEIRKEAEKK